MKTYTESRRTMAEAVRVMFDASEESIEQLAEAYNRHADKQIGPRQIYRLQETTEKGKGKDISAADLLFFMQRIGNIEPLRAMAHEVGVSVWQIETGWNHCELSEEVFKELARVMEQFGRLAEETRIALEDRVLDKRECERLEERGRQLIDETMRMIDTVKTRWVRDRDNGYEPRSDG